MGHVFRIPGEPVGWRHQHSVVHGKPRARLSKRAKAWNKTAVTIIRSQWGTRAPLTGALSIRVVARFFRPGSMECDHRPLKCWERPEDKRLCSEDVVWGVSAPHIGTPDLTNIVKLAEDALVRAGVIEDDRLVCESSGRKRYPPRGDEPEVRIYVEEIA